MLAAVINDADDDAYMGSLSLKTTLLVTHLLPSHFNISPSDVASINPNSPLLICIPLFGITE